MIEMIEIKTAFSDFFKIFMRGEVMIETLLLRDRNSLVYMDAGK